MLFHSSEVFKAKDKSNPKKYVAMKKVLMDNEKEGVSFSRLSQMSVKVYINLVFI